MRVGKVELGGGRGGLDARLLINVMLLFEITHRLKSCLKTLNPSLPNLIRQSIGKLLSCVFAFVVYRFTLRFMAARPLTFLLRQKSKQKRRPRLQVWLRQTSLTTHAFGGARVSLRSEPPLLLPKPCFVRLRQGEGCTDYTFQAA